MSLRPSQWKEHDGSPNNPMGWLAVEVEIDSKSVRSRADKVDWAKVQRYRYAGL